MKKLLKFFFHLSGFIFSLSFIIITIILINWYFRSNSGTTSSEIEIENLSVLSPGNHNSNTDLCFYQDHFYLVFQSSATHFYSRTSKLILMKSDDCKSWVPIREFKYEGYELRDPKIVQIKDSLYLYTLKNITFDPEPFQTVVASSKDGTSWTEFSNVDISGFLFWKPKTNDNKTWYNTAYWFEHGKSILIRTIDGRNWETISEIHSGDTNDETALEIMNDGKIIVTARLESDPGWHSGSQFASTLIAYSFPPYTEWNKDNSYIARLDGPALHKIKNKVFAIGRYDPEGRTDLFGLSSIFTKKRTAIYSVSDDKLELICELPSCGDTSYPGIAEKDDKIFISYYTSDTKKDYPWIMGMFLPTEIKILRISKENLYSVL